MFTRICKICGKAFESKSSNTVYCSDKCAKRGAKKAYRSRKMKHISAVRHGDDKEIESIIRDAYRLAHSVAKLCLYKKCSCTDLNHTCEGNLCIHHINHNVLDNRPQNLQWLCEKAHHEIHSQEESCSQFDELKAFVTIRKQEEIRERNLNRQLKRSSN